MFDAIIDAYKGAEPYEIVISESIANALNAGATKIKLAVNNGAFIVEDNAKGMSEQDFMQYHNLFYSTKLKGSAIGFVGIGAKLSLLYGASIITETKSQEIHKASEMKLIDGEVCWRYLENLPFNLDHEGTIYAVEFPRVQKYLTKENITKTVWKNYAAIVLGFYKECSIYFNDEPIKPPSYIKKENFISPIQFSYRDKKFNVYLYLSEKPLPEEEQGFGIVVYGKTTERHFMKLESFIKREFLERISGYVIADKLAKSLRTNKEELKRDPLYKKFERKAREKIKE